MSTDLFAKLVAASGLSAIFADRSLSRALKRAGVDPATLSPVALRRALPDVEKMLATFMEASDVEARMTTIRKLTD